MPLASKIGGADTFHRRADSVDFQKVPQHDFGAKLRQGSDRASLLCTIAPNTEFKRDRFLDGGAAGVSRGACNQYFLS